VAPETRPEERANWAHILLQEALNNPNGQAPNLVVELLSAPSTPEVQRAVSESIGNLGFALGERLDARYIPSLLDLLGSPHGELRSESARALAVYPGPQVPSRLVEIAGDPEIPVPKRLAAIEALGPDMYRRDVMEKLIGLLDAGHPEIVAKVFATLEPASRKTIGPDAQAWRAWWAEMSRLGEEAWLADRVATFRERERAMQGELETDRETFKRHLAELTGKLRDLQRDLFRATPQDQRDTRLVEWLNDPQEEIKLTALAILKARITDEGKRPEGDVASALLELLKSRLSAVRKEVLAILQNLPDPSIVPAILAQLEQEQDPGIREAIFKALGRLNAAEAFPVLIREIAANEARPECIREAALALGRIAKNPAVADRLHGVVEPLLARYRSAAPTDVSLRAGLLFAMAGVGDPQFAPMFQEAVESDDAALLRPAIAGLLAVQDATRMPRLRRHVSHADPLVRLAAIEAIGQLGKEDADLESILPRLNPRTESSEIAREAAWRSFLLLLQNRPPRVRIQAADLLRDVPDREAGYLIALAEDLAVANADPSDLETLWDRIGALLVTQGKFSEAVPYLRKLFSARAMRRDPTAADLGLRLLDALLRTTSFANAPDLIEQLAGMASEDEYMKTRIIETVAQCLNSPEMVADPTRTYEVVNELRVVPRDRLGPEWNRLLDRVATRLNHGSAPKQAIPSAP
jgi:HEAT repeat protein